MAMPPQSTSPFLDYQKYLEDEKSKYDVRIDTVTEMLLNLKQSAILKYPKKDGY